MWNCMVSRTDADFISLSVCVIQNVRSLRRRQGLSCCKAGEQLVAETCTSIARYQPTHKAELPALKS